LGNFCAHPADGGTNLALHGADRMLDHPGVAGPAARLGRGVNLQIAVPDTAPIRAALVKAGVPPYLPSDDRRYRRDEVDIGFRQVLVADPDGYLLRFQRGAGAHPARKTP